MINSVVVIGNLTRDPELRYSAQGTGVANIYIAVNRGYGDEQKTDFFRVVCFSKLAEAVAQYTNKGSLVGVQGRLQSSSYEKDGQRHSVVEIVAQNVKFLDKKSEGSTNKSKDPSGYEHLNQDSKQDEDLPF